MKLTGVSGKKVADMKVGGIPKCGVRSRQCAFTSVSVSTVH